MPLLGSAAMLLTFDVVPEAIEEHDRWHTHEHLPERLAIPGFLRGTRWLATAGEPRYMVLYEVESLQTLASEAYLARLNQPTPWTQRIMPCYRGMSRGLCSVLGSYGFGQGGAAALIRFSTEANSVESLRQWLLDDVLPGVPQKSGLGSAHLLQGTLDAAMTNEQRIRGADRGVDWAIIVTGYDAGMVAGCTVDLCGAHNLPGHGARDVTRATYSTHYSLTGAEMAG